MLTRLFGGISDENCACWESSILSDVVVGSCPLSILNPPNIEFQMLRGQDLTLVGILHLVARILNTTLLKSHFLAIEIPKIRSKLHLSILNSTWKTAFGEFQILPDKNSHNSCRQTCLSNAP